jgi:hypothetical protein
MRFSARTICDEAVGYARQLPDRVALAGALLDAGIAHWGVPDHPTTFQRFDETLAILRVLIAQPNGRRTYGPIFVTWTQWPIGEMLNEDGQHDKAAALAAATLRQP